MNPSNHEHDAVLSLAPNEIISVFALLSTFIEAEAEAYGQTRWEFYDDLFLGPMPDSCPDQFLAERRHLHAVMSVLDPRP